MGRAKEIAAAIVVPSHPAVHSHEFVGKPPVLGGIVGTLFMDKPTPWTIMAFGAQANHPVLNVDPMV